MTQADVSGLGMDMESQRTSRDTLGRDVPHIRLRDDADLKNIYIVGGKLGQGSFGVVHEATHLETKTQWAIKKICRPEPGSSKVKLLDQEIKILKQVNHAHIIHLKEAYETAKMIYLVTELCVGGELKQLLQRKKFFTEDETRHIIRSLADAIVYLHKRDIVHRDLKLENILVKNSLDEVDNGKINIKVTDFGLAVMTGGVGIENMMTDACGTLIYMAPEMMSGRGYSQWCDVWSIGVIMYMLLCGEPPFVFKTKASLLKEIMHEEVTYTKPIWATVSDAAKNVLTCLLRVDPAYRMSANQLLQNPWITGDTNVPAMPFNVLEMMRHYLEQEEITQTGEDLSLTSSEDAQDSSSIPRRALSEPDRNCRSHPKLSPKRHNSLCALSTSTALTIEGGGHHKHCEGTHVCEAWGPPQATTNTQTHTVVKPSSRQLTAKQRRPQEKKDNGATQRAASDLRKACLSSKSKTGSRRPPAASETATPPE